MYGFKGLGDVSYSQFMAACAGPNPNCDNMDQICLADRQNIIDACNQEFMSVNKSPILSLPGQITLGSPEYLTQLAAAGGSVQLAEQAAGESVPPGTSPSEWFAAPGALIGSAGPVSSPAVVTQSSAPNSTGSQAIVTKSSAPAAGTQPGGQPPAAQTGFSFSSIPWWAYAGAAAVALFAFKEIAR